VSPFPYEPGLMKIHFPLMGFNLSGGVRVIINLANGLVNLGHEVRITVPAFRAEPPFPVDERVEVVVLGKETDSRVRYAALLVKLAARWGDIIVATGFKTPYLIRLSIRTNASAAITIYLVQSYEPTVQGVHFSKSLCRRFFHRQVALRSYTQTDHRFYVSRGIAFELGVDQDPIVVHPGVDINVFRPKSSRCIRPLPIGMILSEDRLKGFPVFLEACNSLVDLQGTIDILLLQGGPSCNGIPYQMKMRNTSNDCDLSDYYNELGVFVFPSLSEGFGLPPLEAMACGTPVILTDCGGVSEYAVHEENCLMVPPGDPESLASAIRRMVQSPDLREKLRKAGIETARRFTWEDTVSRFQEGLLKVVSATE